MNDVLLSIGSNVGDRLWNLRDAIERLSRTPGIIVTACAKVYETEPVGYGDQPLFLNTAIEVSTTLPPEDLLEKLKEIELSMGRNQTFRNGPRVIDIDIAFFERMIVHTERLSVPHPCVATRRFVLEPLADIAADFICPSSGKSVQTLRDECSDHNAVSPYRTAAALFE